MNKAICILGLLLFCNGSYAEGYFKTGNDFLQWSTDQNTRGMATAFIMGIVDAETNAYQIEKIITKNKLTRNYFCTPDGVVGKQVTDVAQKYITDHPESRHFAAAVLARIAFITTWPCDDNPYK